MYQQFDESLNYKLPTNVYFGYEKGINKQNYQDILTFINRYVKDNFSSKRNSFFKIYKVTKNPFLEDGYLYEIHEGGEGIAIGHDIIDYFGQDDKKVCFIKIKDKRIQLIRKLNKIETHYLTEDYEVNKEEQIFLDQKRYIKKENKFIMERVFKDKYTFLIISLVSFISSIIFISSMTIIKYGVLKIEEPYKQIKDFNIFPNQGFRNLNSTENSRIVAVMFKDKEWFVKIEVLNSEGTVQYIEQRIFIDQRLRDLAESERKKIEGM